MSEFEILIKEIKEYEEVVNSNTIVYNGKFNIDSNTIGSYVNGEIYISNDARITGINSMDKSADRNYVDSQLATKIDIQDVDSNFVHKSAYNDLVNSYNHLVREIKMKFGDSIAVNEVPQI